MEKAQVFVDEDGLLEAIRTLAEQKFTQAARESGREVTIPHGGNIYSLADIQFVLEAAREVRCRGCIWNGDCLVPRQKALPRLYPCLKWWASLASEARPEDGI